MQCCTENRKITCKDVRQHCIITDYKQQHSFTTLVSTYFPAVGKRHFIGMTDIQISNERRPRRVATLMSVISSRQDYNCTRCGVMSAHDSIASRRWYRWNDLRMFWYDCPEQGRAAEQRGEADFSPVLVCSSSNTHKETSVPTVSDTYHAAASAKSALPFNNHLRVLLYVQESNAGRACI